MDDISLFFEDYINGIVTNIKNRFDDAYKVEFKKAVKSHVLYRKQKTEEWFKESIDKFYSGYSPVSGGYSRRYSLYNVLDTNIVGDYEDVDVEYDSEKMTGYRNGYNDVDGLFDTVFMKGWHGGASSGDNTLFRGKSMFTPHPSPGTPYYRTPLNIYRYWGYKAERERISPYEDIENKLNEAYSDGGEFQKKWEELHANAAETALKVAMQ